MSPPDLSAFCLLDDHGLTVTGQEISPHKTVLECRVTGPARLLDMVPGRSKNAFKTWLAQRPKTWRDGVDVVAMDGFTGYKTAAGEEIPGATAVMDPFHVVALFGDALDKTRQRVQQETLGHRGRTGDPLSGCRRLLQTGLGLLEQHQLATLEDIFDEHPGHLAVEVIPVLTVQGECGHDASTATEPVDLGTITADVRRLGTVFGPEETADAAADALDARVAAASRPATGASAAWVYYFSSEDPLSSYGSTGMPAAVLTAAGLGNVYADQSDAYLTVSAESLLQAQPTWLVLTYGLYGETAEQAREKLLAEPGIAQLDAVQAGRIVLVSADTSSPSPAAVSGLEPMPFG